MSYPTEQLQEHSSAYFVQDHSNLEEMARLEIQDKMLTTGMGGVFPELADQQNVRRVLDVGCGTGGWLMETARTYPTIEKLVGADINSKMVAHASVQAKALGLNERVAFRTMDALRLLEFPPASFDLINQRLGASWIRTWEWTKILLEYQRVCRPGGIIRITEMNGLIENNSSALTQLGNICLETFHHSGRLFTPSNDGVTGHLMRLMTMHGIEDVKSHVYTLVYRAGTESGQCFCEDMARFYHVALPFFHKWTRVPNDYQEIYQQALKEVQQPDFVATMTLLTAWGTRSKDGRTLLMRGLR